MFILPFVTDQASRQLQALGFQWDAILCDKQDISAITVLIDGQNHSGLNAPAARNIFPCSFALDRDEAALPHRFDLARHRKSDRKSTRLNSKSLMRNSYAVFCLQKTKKQN